MAQKKSKREFDFSAYPARKIALKFSFSGPGHGGLACKTYEAPLPTVECVFFVALAKARLVDPDGSLDSEGCRRERCGRMDHGMGAER
jgi:tRNA pseudouridine38/39 synthase